MHAITNFNTHKSSSYNNESTAGADASVDACAKLHNIKLQAIANTHMIS